MAPTGRSSSRRPRGRATRGLDAPPGRGPVPCKFSREVCNVLDHNMSDPRDARDRADGRSAVRDASAFGRNARPHPKPSGEFATPNLERQAPRDHRQAAPASKHRSKPPPETDSRGFHNVLQGRRPNHHRLLDQRGLRIVPGGAQRRRLPRARRRSSERQIAHSKEASPNFRFRRFAAKRATTLRRIKTPST